MEGQGGRIQSIKIDKGDLVCEESGFVSTQPAHSGSIANPLHRTRYEMLGTASEGGTLFVYHSKLIQGVL
jgi:hypothetical protein